MSSHKKLDIDLDEVQGLFKQAKFDIALRKVSNLIKNNKKNFLPYNYRGIIQLNLGNHSQALCDFKTAVELNPNFILGYNNTALCYRAIGNLEYAVNYLKKVIHLDPNILEARINLGSCLSDLGKYSESLNEFNYALQLNPQHEYTHHLIAEVMIKIVNFKSARKHHEAALAINPLNFMNFFLLASDDLWAGDKANAAKNFRKAIEMNPDFTQSFYGLSRAEKISISDPVFLLAKKMNANAKLSYDEQIYLKFFLASIYESSKNQELFFQFLHEGSEIKKVVSNYSNKESAQLFNKIQSIYNKHMPELKEPINEIEKSKKEIKPIYIVGMPRSGTSLLEQILSNHPLVFGAGEVNTLHSSLLNLFSSEIEGKSLSDKLQKIRVLYLEHLSIMTEKRIITDKLPLNFMWIGFIAYMFPTAKIIHIIRDPIATSFSIYKTLFANGSLNFSYDEEDIIEFYKLYENIMQFWIKHLPDNLFTIQYEDLVENPKTVMQGVFSYLDLSYDENVLTIENNTRSVTTASDLQIRDKIYKNSSKSWMEYEKNLQKFTQAFPSL
ncbi:tetratricopeptide repeat-containing sulfotransferase family protein [Candidatus Methylopumilus universalis]|uniref:tetratricopeptide repeat-containing sulfotransferase family protein n=1 Tax=Candidatus Methylopumilus universalis TaxID=2588536 RepID=UPI003BEF0388